MAAPYRLVRSRSSAADFHARVVDDPAPREVWWHEVTGSALVLGSTQSRDVVDTVECARRGVDVVKRRSGGGAVLLVPGEMTWLDVLVPAGADGWFDDIHGPMYWLGHHLAAVIGGLLDGPVDGSLAVHEGAMATTAWSRTVCFDGLGPGEVTLDGHKLVGLSQRRTRAAARLQVCWYSGHDAAALPALLAAAHRPRVDDLRPVATIPAEVAAAVPHALLHRLNA